MPALDTENRPWLKYDDEEYFCSAMSYVNYAADLLKIAGRLLSEAENQIYEDAGWDEDNAVKAFEAYKKNKFKDLHRSVRPPC